jgi:hypothetical protein
MMENSELAMNILNGSTDSADVKSAMEAALYKRASELVSQKSLEFSLSLSDNKSKD